MRIPGDSEALEGLGVIVREGLDRVNATARPCSPPLWPTSTRLGRPTSQLLAGAATDVVLAWWRRYLTLLVPPVLAAYVDHGVVFEPHLQNVVVSVDGGGWPTQMLLRDLEGTKLLPGHADNADFLASLPIEVSGPMTYDDQRGWDRVVYCLLVNHVAEVLAALADLHPSSEAALWGEVRRVLEEYAATHGCPPALAGLLAGVPLPAKANLLTRWERRPDREAGYVRLASPLSAAVLAEAGARPCTAGGAAR